MIIVYFIKKAMIVIVINILDKIIFEQKAIINKFKRASKFGVYSDALEVRMHWDIKDMVISVKQLFSEFKR